MRLLNTVLLLAGFVIAMPAQQGVTYKIEHNAKGTYDLRNGLTGELVLKNCDRIDSIRTPKNSVNFMADNRYLAVVRKKKAELFRLSTGTIVFSEKGESCRVKHIPTEVEWTSVIKPDTIRNPEITLVETDYDAYLFNMNTGTVLCKLPFSSSEIYESPVNHHFMYRPKYADAKLIDRTGKILLDSIDNVKEIPGGNYMVKDKSGWHHIYDRNVKPMKGKSYASLRSEPGCGNLLLAVNENKKTGVITPAGKEVIPFEYNISDHSDWDWSNRVNMGLNGVFFLYKDRNLEIIDSTGKKLADSLGVVINHKIIDNRFVLLTAKNERQGIFDTKTKKMTIPPVYDLDPASGYGNEKLTEKMHLMGAVKNNRWGLINMESGEVVIPFLYQAEENQHLRWPYKYTSISDRLVFDTYFIVKKNGLYGVVDLHGKELTAFEYEKYNFLRDYSEKNVVGLALLKNGYWGIIHHLTMKPILPFEYSEITSRYLRVKKEENGVIREGSLNNKMEVIWNK